MKHFFKETSLETKTTDEFYDITEVIRDYVEESGIRNGHVIIQPKHTTTGIFLNEGEERLLQDFVEFLSEKAPKDKGYKHDDIPLRKDNCPDDEPVNGHSHMRTALYSNPSLDLILHDGELYLGTYQRILFAEFDGPCPRKHKSERSYGTMIIGE